MIPTLTSLDVVNRALVEISRGQPLASGDPSTNFDGTPAGIYAAQLYQGAVQMLLRQQDFEFSRRVVSLSTTGGTAPYPWTAEYTYPTDCIKIRQVTPATWDVNDPQPIRWEEGTALVSAVQTVVIWAGFASAKMTYTTNAVTEGEWDDGFTEIAVRYLGSQLAMPVAGRPDLSREFLHTAGSMGPTFADRDS